MKILIYTIITALIFSFMIGCKAKTIYVPVESAKTEYRDRLEVDSFYQKDSIYLYINGDSVIKYVFKDRWRNKYIHDTINKTDSIAVPYPVVEVKEVNKLNSFQSFQMWCGRILLLLVGGYGVYRLIRWKFFK